MRPSSFYKSSSASIYFENKIFALVFVGICNCDYHCCGFTVDYWPSPCRTRSRLILHPARQRERVCLDNCAHFSSYLHQVLVVGGGHIFPPYAAIHKSLLLSTKRSIVDCYRLSNTINWMDYCKSLCKEKLRLKCDNCYNSHK